MDEHKRSAADHLERAGDEMTRMASEPQHRAERAERRYIDRHIALAQVHAILHLAQQVTNVGHVLDYIDTKLERR